MYVVRFEGLESEGLKWKKMNCKILDVSKNRGKNPKMDGENNGKPY